MVPVFLNSVGITCALGSGLGAVAAALFDAREPSGVETTERYTPGRPLALGTVRAPLADLSAFALPFQSRNNALLLTALEQMRSDVSAAIERWGAERVAIVLGTSTSGVGEAETAVSERLGGGSWPARFHYGQQEIGAPSRFLAAASGARGPAWTLSTACSSSAKAMASAARILRAGIADAVIAGGADSLCAFTINGFSALESVSATRCNPFSRNRCGINIGEGAALFLMTCEPGPVRLAGWGESSDAHHISAPDPQGAGALAAIDQALARAGIGPGEIGYVNLHGTATRQNDAMEARAVMARVGPGTPVSSTKPLTGHALGAAGAIEAALCWMTLVDNPGRCLPPHWWDGALDPELPPLAFVPPGGVAQQPLGYALSHSFAFGGSNAVLLFGAG